MEGDSAGGPGAGSMTCPAQPNLDARAAAVAVTQGRSTGDFLRTGPEASRDHATFGPMAPANRWLRQVIFDT